ncbi:Metallo-dependent phosphatase-like protein [Diplogelasinospora grovesii]|uniref:Metallo-dependent phosphatase-like protein n=1 Tax=Diplogelasinospora grovesii TaxID=303347 RepID=A0AAN6S5K4_9PEZI|nr:Metallo-dependent phosphatase-like protein [Diplogelasinospora grovesii]
MDTSSATPNPTRRTRIVCISDTHNCTVKLPKGDVLIHAGDLTNQGSYSEKLSKSIQWLEKANFEAKIVIAGNHDITLDQEFYTQHGQYFHNQNPEDAARCLSLLTSSRTITYLSHSSATIRLEDPNGPRTQFTVFGSPYSPRDGMWAFGYDRGDLDVKPSGEQLSVATGPPIASGPTASTLWSAIPMDTDILVTHTPSHTHCDECPIRRRALGCEELRKTLWRIRPRLHVCGHVHQGRGAERVQWDIDGSGGNVTYAEAGVERWEDPSPDRLSAKMSLVDLTRRGGKRPLDNQDSAPSPTARIFPDAHLTRDKSSLPNLTRRDGLCGSCLPRSESRPPVGSSGPKGRDDDSSRPSHNENQVFDRGAGVGIGTRGLGGDPATSARCDRVALSGRMGRRETCVVNCAIVASNWPHAGGKQFNKPIVVDLDLPVWR